jgi:hypothetical protein
MTTVTEKRNEQVASETVLKPLRMIYREIQALEARIDRLESASRLGFGQAPVCRIINCKRKDGMLWYFWNGPERGAEPIEHTAITGYARDLRIEEGEYKGKPTHKVQLLLDCGDRSFILEAGWGSNFANGIVLGICSVTADALRSPVTIAPVPGDDEKVLFCNFFQGGQRVTVERPANPDWNSLFAQAVATVNRANQ